MSFSLCLYRRWVLCMGLVLAPLLFFSPKKAYAQATQLFNSNVVVAGHANYCQATAATNAYACALDRTVTAYTAGACYTFRAPSGNTGPATINLSSLGAVPVKKRSGGSLVDLIAGDIGAGYLVHVCYDGTQMQMLSPPGNAPSGTGTGGLQPVASGTLALATAAIASGTCAPAQQVSAPGALATDVVVWSFQGDPTTVPGYAPAAGGILDLRAYAQANTFVAKVCNNTSTSKTPGPLTVNWKILPGGVLPPGVTLTQIDGGPDYYCSHGFTHACAAGWDNPSFFPIGPWLAPMAFQSDADRWHDLGWNTAWSVDTNNASLALFTPNQLNLIIYWEQIASWLPSQGGNLGPATVGIMAWDEPSTIADALHALSTIANVHQDNRFWWENYVVAQIVYGIEGVNPMDALLSTLVTTPNATQRHIDIASVDSYWMAGTLDPYVPSNLQQLYALDHLPTPDEQRRGAHYGHLIDRQRPWQAGHYPAPRPAFIENGGPYNANTTAASYIQPEELPAAVWNSLMHGARGLAFFNHSFAGPAVSYDNLAQVYYQTIQPGKTISMYNQTKAVITRVKALAPVLNAPFANGYATVSPAPSNFAGIDVAVKYAGQQFYVFAMPKYSPTLLNQTATFTVKSGSTATVLDEARAIPIVGGQFTDTFATSNTVHIYRIDP